MNRLVMNSTIVQLQALLKWDPKKFSVVQQKTHLHWKAPQSCEYSDRKVLYSLESESSRYGNQFFFSGFLFFFFASGEGCDLQ